jgi:K(+)-stimulated pyrophosphate-energized sodium pump
MVDEVRRQFREIPGIMDGKGKPEYAKCVEISTAGAQKEMMVPSLMAITVPLVVGIVFGVPGVVGLLAGGMTSGFTLACMLNNSGGAWDNAKKFIEDGNLGGKGSPSSQSGCGR